MRQIKLDEVLHSAPAERPAVLEGRWLAQDGSHALIARRPVSVLEGGEEALAELPGWLARHADQYPAGAAIGFLSYEVASRFEALLLARFDSCPDLSFAYYPQIERVRRTHYLVPDVPSGDTSEVKANFDERTFIEAVQRIRDYLVSGDIYQANLTQQFAVSVTGRSPEKIYEQLSAGHAPFRAFLKSPAGTIISNSPERFFYVSGRRIVASPIKGTTARPGGPLEDERAVASLLASAKDRAENIMIVDLIRNDLGRVCRYGSIGARLFEVEALPHLFHLVSHVQGTLRPEVGLVELLRALFPCGSVTGAPKIRAMEILSEVENAPRGISMGAIGIVMGDPKSGWCEMDFNVAIRTLVIQADLAVFNVGCGIVYDSNPEAEYEEMMLKARPLLQVLGATTAFKRHAVLTGSR